MDDEPINKKGRKEFSPSCRDVPQDLQNLEDE